MLEEIILEEQNFQRYLLANHYSFIGPDNPNLFESFIQHSNLIAPNFGLGGTIHNVLSHKNTTITALEILPQNTQLRVYIIIPNSSQILFHSSIPEYCNQNNIVYP